MYLKVNWRTSLYCRTLEEEGSTGKAPLFERLYEIEYAEILIPSFHLKHGRKSQIVDALTVRSILSVTHKLYCIQAVGITKPP